MTIHFTIYENSGNPAETCECYSIIEKLYNQKILIYDKNDFGNCFEIAANIITTLDKQGFEIGDWLYVVGDCVNGIRHCWLEHKGWAIDFSSGQSLFMPTEDFYRIREVKKPQYYTIERLRDLSKNPATSGLKKYFDY